VGNSWRWAEGEDDHKDYLPVPVCRIGVVPALWSGVEVVEVAFAEVAFVVGEIVRVEGRIGVALEEGRERIVGLEERILERAEPVPSEALRLAGQRVEQKQEVPWRLLPQEEDSSQVEEVALAVQEETADQIAIVG